MTDTAPTVPELDPQDPSLQDPNLLDSIKEKYLDPKITGENKNKQLLFLVSASAFTQRPLSTIVKGPSAAGKSHLVNRVLDVFRKMGIVIEFSRITPAFLENMANKDRPRHPNPKAPDYEAKLEEYERERKKPRSIDLTGKILFIDELRGIQNAQAPKLMISEGRLRLGTVDVNRESVELEVGGTPVIITTTTLAVLEDPEFENRVIPIQIDETEDQTERVLEYQASSYGDPAQDLTEHTRTQALVDFFKQLKPYDVANPYSWQLARDYPKKNLEARRDYPKLMNLCNVVTWLYQYQRRHAKKGLDIFLVTTLSDIETVKGLALPSLKESLTGVSEKEQAILDFLQGQKEEQKDSFGNVEKTIYSSVTCSDVYAGTRKKTRKGEDWTRKRLKRLVDEGYAEEEEAKPRRFQYRYSEFPPETLEIKTNLYSNQVEEEWAKALGYTLLGERLAVNSSTSQGQAESGSYPNSEQVIPRYAPYQHRTLATGEYQLGQAGNRVVDEQQPSTAMACPKGCGITFPDQLVLANHLSTYKHDEASRP